MAESQDNSAASGATATPSPAPVQSPELSLDDILTELRTENYRNAQSVADKAVDALRKEVLPSLELSKQTHALVKRLALGESMTSEEMNQIETETKEADRIKALEATYASSAAENAALKKQSLANEEVLDRELGYATHKRLLEFLKERDVPWADVEDIWLAERKAVSAVGTVDRFHWQEREAAVKAKVLEIAKRNLRDETPPANVPSGVPNGAVGADLSAFQKMRIGMAEQRQRLGIAPE